MVKRNGRGRRTQFVIAAALAVAGSASLPADAAGGGIYNVIQCYGAGGHRGTDQLRLQGNGDYVANDKCSGGDARLQVHNSGDAVRNQGRWWSLDAPPGTLIRAFHVTANLRSGNGHKAQLTAWNGNNNDLLAQGPSSGHGWADYHFGGLHHPAVVMLLQCQQAKCAEDTQAHMYARAIDVHLEDVLAPSGVDPTGSITAGGWLRGSHTLSASASDQGSGVWRVVAYVNGSEVARSPERCNNGGLAWPSSKVKVPCPDHLALDASTDTSKPPFRNGENELTVGAADWSANVGPAWKATIYVDNAPPAVAFADSQDPDQPELITATVADEHSGVAEAKLFMRRAGASDWAALDSRLDQGKVTAHVDSGALPAGEYEFRAVARDVAGNVVETTERRSGGPMRLTFPLRDPVRLHAHLNNGASRGQTVPYGTDAAAVGRLLDADGRPLAGKRVTIVENFGEGALIRERISTATTDADGRWSSKIPAGPNRRITARFGGTAKYAPARADVGKLVVRSRVRFRTKRRSVSEGGTMTFHGKVGHFGARIPSGGKLLELQVRMPSGRWDTVGEAFRTRPDGTYRRRYRFGRHYLRDAVFRFRVKLKNEANWPFRKAASKHRKVIVRAR